jgi:3-dehydroquinate synthase
MSRIPVRLGARSYPILVTTSYRSLPGQLARLTASRDAWVISHASVLARHGRALLGPLQAAGWHVRTLSVPERETSKSLAMVGRIVGALSRTARMRVPVLVAFGGGVVGDLTGFVAAVYRRGVPYVQAPTTLLGQVDSAIGGKVGVDLPHAKNFVGAFYQPRLVVNNLAVLRSLPRRQRRSGLAEVIKYGAIADRALFAYLERHLSGCLALAPAAARRLVTRSCRIKAQVVSRDERETGEVRAQLNFGHTVGHALEAATAYRRWTHGEAIAIGMAVAADLSVAVGRCPAREAARLITLLEAAGLPTRARSVSRQAVRRAMAFDKKFIRGRPRWVLLQGIGRVTVTEAVPPAAAARALAGRIGRAT